MTSWTKEQNDAINLSGSNIIVSAGAGSGKTAVLTQRVITKLLNGIHLDELLILTFTNNAAHEMKERIRKALESNHLENELKLIDNAQITTFDAYALSLVKKYHSFLNLDRNINIINASIINLEKKTFIDEIFSSLYQNSEADFINFVTTFGLKNDKEIRNLLLSIDNQLDLLINKDVFFDNYIVNYYNENNVNKLINDYNNLLIHRVNFIKNALYNISSEVDNTFYQALEIALTQLLNAKTYDEIRSSLDITLPRLPNNSSNEAKDYKNQISNQLKSLKEATYYSKESIINDFNGTKKHAIVIVDILKELNNKTNNFKNKYQKFEFNDISKLAILLVKNNDEIRNELKYSYQEIMIDEYQDTSDLQEEFISLIQNNNIYMVGDIKQSIYRFRNANPDIFKNKYDLYKNNDGGIKIDLNKNFRSRDDVLNSINNIFNHIMDDDIGNALYKNEHQMIFGNMAYNEIGKNDYDNNLLIFNYQENRNFSNEEIEAFIIGNDIKNKIDNKYMVMGKDELIPCSYNDFCILMDRTNSFDIYKKAFDYLKIPLKIYKDDNILFADETNLFNNIIGLILCIKNKTYNEKFKFYYTSIARSYLFRISDQDIYDNVTHNKIYDTDIYKICLSLIPCLDNTSNYEFLNLIVDKFDFYQKMIKVGNINYRTLIINYILELVSELNAVDIDIYGLNDYFNLLIENGSDLRLPAIIDDSDAVTITNIHKSKGLEYKICYYSGLHKNFPLKDIRERIIFNNKYGLILPVYDQGFKKVFTSDLNKEQYIKDEISEKLRLFYVALTRCKEKMIIVTSLNSDKVKLTDKNEVVDYLERINYKSFRDILNSIYPYLEQYIKDTNIPVIDVKYKIQKEFNIKDYLNNDKGIVVKVPKFDNQLIDEGHFSKSSKNLIDANEKRNMEYGTRMHYILENMDFINPKFEMLNNIEKNTVEALLSSPIMANINKAKIYKEYEFVDKNTDSINFGIIDLMLEYNDYIDIIDYKLKNTNDSAYIKQLNGYKNYVEKKRNKKVNIYLYSLLDKKLIKLD